MSERDPKIEVPRLARHEDPEEPGLDCFASGKGLRESKRVGPNLYRCWYCGTEVVCNLTEMSDDSDPPEDD